MNYLQRKKLAFMSIVNSVKGFVRTVLGIPPLTLPDCVDNNSIINYSIDGNSVQDGTPTPEAPVEVESVGEYDESTGKYKISVVCSGKNMFDKEAFCDYYNSFGTLKANENDNYLGEDCFSYYLCQPSATSEEFEWLTGKFKENTSYVFSGYASMKWANVESQYVTYLFLRYTDGTNAYVNATLYTDRFTKIKFVTNSTKTIKCISMVNYSAGVPIYMKDFQIEEGTTETEYEPYVESVTTNIYLDEPLRKVSTYADTVDFKKRIVNRAIKEKIFTGDATEWWNVWTASATENTVGVYYRNNEELGTYTDQKIVTVVGCSNYFKTTAYSLATQDDSKVGQCCISGTSNPPYIAFKVPFTSKEAWLEWLNGKYIGNEPLKVYWVCKETTETPITLPKLPTIKGTTIYSIDTAIQPSNMEVTYYSTSKE